MLRRIAIVLAACGGGPKPVAPVDKGPEYTCATSIDAQLKAPRLDGEKDRVRSELLSACRKEQWPDEYLACTSTGAQPCTDTRPGAQRSFARMTIQCGIYAATVARLGQCPSFPSDRRDAIRAQLDAVRPSWNLDAIPPDARMQAADVTIEACDAATDATVRSAKAAGC